MGKKFPEGGRHMPPDPAAHKVGQKWGTEPKPDRKPPRHKRGKK